MSGNQMMANVTIAPFNLVFKIPLFEENSELFVYRADVDKILEENKLGNLIAYPDNIEGYSLFIADAKRPWDGQTFRCFKENK